MSNHWLTLCGYVSFPMTLRSTGQTLTSRWIIPDESEATLDGGKAGEVQPPNAVPTNPTLVPKEWKLVDVAGGEDMGSIITDRAILLTVSREGSGPRLLSASRIGNLCFATSESALLKTCRRP